MSTTCRVRIYVPVDGNGNYKTTDNYAASECRGHYDFQICRMGYIGTTTNRESFSSPIISYGHIGLNNRRNEVAFSRAVGNHQCMAAIGCVSTIGPLLRTMTI